MITSLNLSRGQQTVSTFILHSKASVNFLHKIFFVWFSVFTLTPANFTSAKSFLALPVTFTYTSTNVDCYGNNNGSITVIPVGGTGSGYSMVVDGISKASTTYSPLAPGSHTVYVQDGSGKASAPQTFIITQPAAPLTTTTTTVPISCNGKTDASITLNPSGGTPGYSYTQSQINNIALGKNTASSSNESASYPPSLAVDGINSFASRWSSQFSDPQWMYVDLGTPTALSSVQLYWETALGKDFTIQISNDAVTWTTVSTVTGNTAATNILPITGVGRYVRMYGTARGTIYGYSLVEFQIYAATPPLQTSNVFNNLGAGTYTFTTKDKNGCTSSNTVVISQPAVVSFTTAQTNINCFGASTGSITVTGSGGTGTLQYSDNNGTSYQLSNFFSNLPSGNYTVIVKDANGCLSPSKIITITQPAAALTSSISAQTNVKCFGGSTGTATVTPAGGTGTDTYSWSTSPVQTAATATGLAVGSYTVTVTDANGCTTTSTATITQPASALTSSISAQTNVKCFGGSTGAVTVAAAGGTSTYSYTLGGVTNTTGTFSALAAGTYTVNITDANGCTTVQSVTITQPAAKLSVSISSQSNVLCSGNNTASVNLIGAGGSGSYTYSSDGTIFTNTTGFFNGLISGSYTFTVKDAGGCMSTASTLILTNLQVLANDDSTTITMGATATMAILANDKAGSAQIDASSVDLDPSSAGIQKSYTVTGKGTFTVDNNGTVTFISGALFSGKVSATYQVADINGCYSNNASINISVRPTVLVAKNDTITINQGSAIVIPVLSNFISPLLPKLTIRIRSSAVNGNTTVLANGDVEYVPFMTFTGTETFKYDAVNLQNPALVSNIATITVIVLPRAQLPQSNLSLTLQAGPTVYTDTYSYTFKVKNTGPGIASSVTVTDTLPSGLSYVSSTPETGISGFNGTSNAVSWTIPSIAAGEEITMTVFVHTTSLGTIINTAWVNSAAPNTVFKNHYATAIVNKITGNIIIPTAFTPNGDGDNDLFEIKYLDRYPDNDIEIFNRWGNQVYKAQGYMQNGKIWDGSNLLDGTYYYILHVNMNGAYRTMSGYTTIISGRH